MLLGLQESQRLQSHSPVLDDLFLQRLGKSAWQAEQLLVAAQTRKCSLLMLANTTLTGNQALGAGGAMYITSPVDFYNICPTQPGEHL